jgi:hypothetical protein
MNFHSQTNVFFPLDPENCLLFLCLLKYFNIILASLIVKYWFRVLVETISNHIGLNMLECIGITPVISVWSSAHLIDSNFFPLNDNAI